MPLRQPVAGWPHQVEAVALRQALLANRLRRRRNELLNCQVEKHRGREGAPSLLLIVRWCVRGALQRALGCVPIPRFSQLALTKSYHYFE